MKSEIVGTNHQFHSYSNDVRNGMNHHKISDHFNGKTFYNSVTIAQKGFGSILKWLWTRRPGEWKKSADLRSTKSPVSKVKEGIRITFVNHSTFLLQMDGLNILADPIWSNRASPFSWIGPKRKRMAGIAFEDLPKIDAVIVSHNHYDHLDLPTLQKLAAAHSPKIVVPLGVKKFLESKGISNVVELDWWDDTNLNNMISVQAVPAQHFSGRGIFDRNTTLWCGYVIKTSLGNIYFAGDTGYNSEMFQEITKRCGPIRFGLLPIGAYKPQWFMSPVHASPEEAVKIHMVLDIETSIGMHFGTFCLADDGQEDPIQDLQKAIKKFRLDTDEFVILKEGSYFEIEHESVVNRNEKVAI
ncbi:MBL fold metallo-hydrolase [bacterium]|nr:MBL fold metallo-hydrolase [bacterium]